MKKSTKIILSVFLILLAGFIIFQNRISGTYKIFQLTTEVTSLLSEGSDNYKLHISAGMRTADHLDTLNAYLSYKNNVHFTANVDYNKDKYIIHNNQDSTSVYVSKTDLLISGKNAGNGEFDIVKLLGSILSDYPDTDFIPSMSWSKRAGLSAWLFFKAGFKKQVINNQVYHVIILPEDSPLEGAELWLNDQQNDYFLNVKNENQQIGLHISLTDTQTYEQLPSLETTKRINVDGKELNTAIYRGALRTGGIFLENMNPPKPDGIERKWGKGILTYVNNNRVLIAKGSHYEIGEAHGALLKEEIRKLVDATLYTINWVYTIEKGSWFLDDLRGAYKREAPFIPEKYQEEMKGMAKTSEISLEEIRLTNVFPALFHCSGFALFDSATVDGKLYHGRILDYITELGLQYYPLVQILKPEGSYAFANIGFAGFIGSVTGMNEHQVTFGEMGGRGEGDWDGMPMALLMREGMEKAKTMDEALTIFRETPRTCEYYYVISDGKIPDARGLATTPEMFQVIKPNEFHELLNEPVKDAVLMSAGSRYKKLVERVKAQYGTIDAEKAIRLMDRPVAMNSALHIVLFAPQSLEFWVANAGSGTPACNEPYTHYSMSELLKLIDE
ncbi:MAG: hypothetical protein J7L04_04565 [Bacteroidales bacterium]|nr:hypothetical protein [Bacteroidales bacterium]